MKKSWLIFYAVLVGAVLVGNAGAQETNVDLEDLIYLGVSVATKKVESIHQAPGVISVITAEDIARTPSETLYDVIKSIPGVTVSESFFGYTSLAFRGVKESHYNNRTLLLLNGTPIRDATVGTHWLEAIPVNIIKKIEIIRGPGSVLYGTGAFAGVISVITKSATDIMEVGVTAGSKTTTNGELTLGMKFEMVDFLVGGSYNQHQGYKVDAVDETGITAQLGYYDLDQDAYENDFYNLFGNISAGDFRLDIYHFKQEKDKFGIVPVHAMTGEVETSASGSTLHYEKKLEEVQLNARVHYAISSYDGYMDSFAGTEIDMKYSGAKYGMDVDGIYEIWSAAFVSAGISYERQATDPYEFYDLALNESHWASAFLSDYTADDISVYSQVEFGMLEKLKVVGGVRYNNNSEYGGTYVPRVSMVYLATEKLFVKLLYGSAFRNPTFFEKYVNTRNVLYGDPDLNPERIATLELSADWSVAKQGLRLTLFGLKTDDMIGRIVTYQSGDIPAITELEDRESDTTPSRATPGYGNAEGQRIYGVEFDIRGEILGEKLLGYIMNCSYKEGKEKSDWSPIQYLDQVVVNASLENRISGFTNVLTINYIGERKGTISDGSLSPDFTPGQEVVVPAHVLLNWKTTYQIFQNLEISLVITNILGQEVLYPEHVRRNIDVVPGDGGTNFFGQIKYRF